MSLSFPPIYQNFIELWSPFSRIEPVSEVYNEKQVANKVEGKEEQPCLILYNKHGKLEYYNGYST